MTKAIMDLGTNTFHILIAKVGEDGGIVELFKERLYVYLGSDGIDFIGRLPFKRGVEAMTYFASVIAKFPEIVETRAIGTAALRKAENAEKFVSQVRESTGIEIEVVSGTQEAQFIAKGVGLLFNESKQHLIMDIGGGSVEFILGDKEVRWCHSFEIGISILHSLFHIEDPIADTSLEKMYGFLDSALAPLEEVMSDKGAFYLIGAAGTFEVLSSSTATGLEGGLHSIASSEVLDLYEECRVLSLKDRIKHPKIPMKRAKYIVVALGLIKYVIDKYGVDRLYISPYALKEGVLASNI